MEISMRFLSDCLVHMSARSGGELVSCLGSPVSRGHVCSALALEFQCALLRAAAVEFKREPPATSHLPRPTKPWTQNFSFRARRQGTSERSILGRM